MLLICIALSIGSLAVAFCIINKTINRKSEVGAIKWLSHSSEDLDYDEVERDYDNVAGQREHKPLGEQTKEGRQGGKDLEKGSKMKKSSWKEAQYDEPWDRKKSAKATAVKDGSKKLISKKEKPKRGSPSPVKKPGEPTMYETFLEEERRKHNEKERKRQARKAQRAAEEAHTPKILRSKKESK